MHLSWEIRWLSSSVCQSGIIPIIWDTPQRCDNEPWHFMQSRGSISTSAPIGGLNTCDRVILWHRQHPRCRSLLVLCEGEVHSERLLRNIQTLAHVNMCICICRLLVAKVASNICLLSTQQPRQSRMSAWVGTLKEEERGGRGSGKIEPNRKRQEERWPDKPYGSLLLCSKGSHLYSHSWPTWPGGKF